MCFVSGLRGSHSENGAGLVEGSGYLKAIRDARSEMGIKLLDLNGLDSLVETEMEGATSDPARLSSA
jgi:hypothetical protein